MNPAFQPLVAIPPRSANRHLRGLISTAFAFDGTALMFKIKSSFERTEDIKPIPETKD